MRTILQYLIYGFGQALLLLAVASGQSIHQAEPIAHGSPAVLYVDAARNLVNSQLDFRIVPHLGSTSILVQRKNWKAGGDSAQIYVSDSLKGVARVYLTSAHTRNTLLGNRYYAEMWQTDSLGVSRRVAAGQILMSYSTIDADPVEGGAAMDSALAALDSARLLRSDLVSQISALQGQLDTAGVAARGQIEQDIETLFDSLATIQQQIADAGKWQQIGTRIEPKSGVDTLTLAAGSNPAHVVSSSQYRKTVHGTNEIGLSSTWGTYVSSDYDVAVNSGNDMNFTSSGFMRFYPSNGIYAQVGLYGDEWITSGGRGWRINPHGRVSVGAAYSTVPQWIYTQSARIDSLFATRIIQGNPSTTIYSANFGGNVWVNPDSTVYAGKALFGLGHNVADAKSVNVFGNNNASAGTDTVITLLGSYLYVNPSTSYGSFVAGVSSGATSPYCVAIGYRNKAGGGTTSNALFGTSIGGENNSVTGWRGVNIGGMGNTASGGVNIAGSSNSAGVGVTIGGSGQSASGNGIGIGAVTSGVGQYSVLLGGRYHNAGGNVGVLASGMYTAPLWDGSMVRGYATQTFLRDNQWVHIGLTDTTNSDVPDTLSIPDIRVRERIWEGDTTNNGNWRYRSVYLNVGQSLAFRITVNGTSDSANVAATYIFEGMIRRSRTGVTTFVGTPAKTEFEDDPSWDCEIYADDARDCLLIIVKGSPWGRTKWLAIVEGPMIDASS